MQSENKPRFLLAAEELAQQRGTDSKEILHRDREQARNSDYPGPDCLVPDEIEYLFADPAGAEAGRAKHAISCPACSALLASAGADLVETERILACVRAKARVPSNPAPTKDPIGGSVNQKIDLDRVRGRLLATLVAAVFAVLHLLRFFKRRRSPSTSSKSPRPVPEM